MAGSATDTEVEAAIAGAQAYSNWMLIQNVNISKDAVLRDHQAKAVNGAVKQPGKLEVPQ